MDKLISVKSPPQWPPPTCSALKLDSPNVSHKTYFSVSQTQSFLRFGRFPAWIQCDHRFRPVSGPDLALPQIRSAFRPGSSGTAGSVPFLARTQSFLRLGPFPAQTQCDRKFRPVFGPDPELPLIQSGFRPGPSATAGSVQFLAGAKASSDSIWFPARTQYDRGFRSVSGLDPA